MTITSFRVTGGEHEHLGWRLAPREDATSVPAGFLYNGALSTYENLGFTRERKIGKHRWAVTMNIEPSS